MYFQRLTSEYIWPLRPRWKIKERINDGCRWQPARIDAPSLRDLLNDAGLINSASYIVTRREWIIVAIRQIWREIRTIRILCYVTELFPYVQHIAKRFMIGNHNGPTLSELFTADSLGHRVSCALCSDQKMYNYNDACIYFTAAIE